MKNQVNTNKVNKKFIKIILAVVIVMIFLSIILLVNSVLPKKQTSLNDIGYAFGNSKIHTNRKFTVESKEEHIYNIGDYDVNVDNTHHLRFNVSIKCQNDSLGTLLENKIIIQNAVIETFSIYGNNYRPNTSNGKDKIKNKIKQNIDKYLDHPLVTEVYFNKFLIQ
ncbi:flagellar basal body-associated protein FliL [Campylobacterota bacterium]